MEALYYMHLSLSNFAISTPMTVFLELLGNDLEKALCLFAFCWWTDVSVLSVDALRDLQSPSKSFRESSAPKLPTVIALTNDLNLGSIQGTWSHSFRAWQEKRYERLTNVRYQPIYHHPAILDIMSEGYSV